MVRENVVWQVNEAAGYALTQWEIAPVCAACVTPAEEADATVERVCEGCGLTMRSRFRGRTCSARCAMRASRARRRRFRPMNRCIVCGASFKPKRSESVYCSSACKQRAYRRKTTGFSLLRLTKGH